MSTAVDGLVVYLAIVASVLLALLVAVKAKSWTSFLLGMFAIFFAAIILVALVTG
jgi:hypothetical protein